MVVMITLPPSGGFSEMPSLFPSLSLLLEKIKPINRLYAKFLPIINFNNECYRNQSKLQL